MLNFFPYQLTVSLLFLYGNDQFWFLSKDKQKYETMKLQWQKMTCLFTNNLTKTKLKLKRIKTTGKLKNIKQKLSWDAPSLEMRCKFLIIYDTNERFCSCVMWQPMTSFLISWKYSDTFNKFYTLLRCFHTFSETKTKTLIRWIENSDGIESKCNEILTLRCFSSEIFSLIDFFGLNVQTTIFLNNYSFSLQSIATKMKIFCSFCFYFVWNDYISPSRHDEVRWICVSMICNCDFCQFDKE